MPHAHPLRGALALAASAALAAAQGAPSVLALSPPHLAVGVDAARTNKLSILFDRDMDTSRHALCGGGPTFPAVSATSWRDARTLVLDVALVPGQIYAMTLACSGSAGFRDRAGAPLAPQPWRFATAGEPLPEGVAAAATQRLFAVIDDHYSYRDHLGVDWAAVERQWHERLTGAGDAAAFALGVAELLAVAQDAHIAVEWHKVALPTWQRAVTPNFDQRGLRRVLPHLEQVSRIGLAARTDDGIGYLLVSTFAAEARADFDLLLQRLRELLDCQGLVIDVRPNGGGDELLARRLAAFFVDGERVYAAHRIRDPQAPGGFHERQDRRITGNSEPDVYRRPVAVLMGPQNMSSCEAFLLMMRRAERAFLVGERSYGSSGNPHRHGLFPGLAVLLPSWQALRPDGTTFEGEGVEPHLHVAAHPEQLATGDPVLEEALRRLRSR